MKAIHAWMLIAATILIGLVGLTANAQECRVKVNRSMFAHHARVFCESPTGEFVFQLKDNTAVMAGRREVSVPSFGVERLPL